MKRWFGYILATTCIFLQGTLFSLDAPQKSPYVTDETWEEVKPYLMQENHPIKHKLDAMFGASRIVAGPKTLQAAGFVILRKNNKADKVYVCKHKDFPGYVFKMYLDSQKQSREGHRWYRRCKGALATKECIKKHRLTNMFKVPKKWVYQLPLEPAAAPNSRRKNFILIAEDMNIYSIEKNNHMWKSDKLTKKMLERIYLIVTEVGLSDSVHCANIPFTKKGNLAFIDTEHNNHWPIPYRFMNRYLNNTMQEFWSELVKHKGKIPEPDPLKEIKQEMLLTQIETD